MINRWTLLGVALATLVTSAAAQAQPQDKANARTAKSRDAGDCVYITQLQNSHPLGDRAVIFRANVSDFYRLDFASQCQELSYPEPKIILTPVGGIGIICHALDVDVKVGEQGPGSIPEGCIPSHWHKMTSAEVAAVPKKDLP